jgi:hypothetical protein
MGIFRMGVVKRFLGFKGLDSLICEHGRTIWDYR